MEGIWGRRELKDRVKSSWKGKGSELKKSGG